MTFNLVELMPLRPLFRTTLAAATLVALTACLDRESPVSPDVAGPDPSNRQDFQVTCVASVTGGTVACAQPESVGSQALIIGGQGQYVQVSSDNIAVVENTFSFDVTVQNLIHQPMGTLDGTTPHEDGVRVFFEQLPTTTGGTGSIVVANADGEGTFLRAGQLYYQYPGILGHTETTEPRTWQFTFDPGVETFVFTVFVTAEVPSETDWIDLSETPRYLTLNVDTTLTAVLRDRVGNPIDAEITFSSSDPSIVDVSPDGAAQVIGFGFATITATAGDVVAEQTVGVCSAGLPGRSRIVSGAAATRFCLGGLGGDAAGSNYLIVPVNTSTADVSITALATNVIPVTGGATPSLLPIDASSFMLHGPRTLDEFHGGTNVRQAHGASAIVRFARSRAGLSPAGPSLTIVPGVPAPGDVWTLNVAAGCEGAPAERGARVEVVSDHAVIVVDTLNPAGGMTTGQYEEFAAQVDGLLAPLVYHHLVGDSADAPVDINSNDGRIVYFFSSAINEQLDPTVSQEYGYFTARDLQAAAECARSNEGGIIYLAAGDPGGEVATAVPTDTLRKYAPRTAVHELQHLTNRLIRDQNGAAPEEAWLDEALSLIMQELAFYGEVNEAPGQNIGGAYFGGATGPANIERYGRYLYHTVEGLGDWLANANATGPINGEESRAAAGAGWAFLRYAADRAIPAGDQAPFWRALGSSTLTGRANLEAALPDELPGYLRDFAGALYADDAPGLGSVETWLRLPSWNFRSLFAGVGGYPLVTTPLVDGTADTRSYAAGGGTAWLVARVDENEVGEFSFDLGGAPADDFEVMLIALP